MEMEKIYEGLNEIFRDVFDDDSLVVTETTTAADIEEWDSLAGLSILAMLDSDYNTTMSGKEIAAFNSIETFCKEVLSRQ